MPIDIAGIGAAAPEPWSLLNLCDEVVVVADRAFRLLYRNDRAGELIPGAAESLLGRSLWELLPATADKRFETELRKAVRERQPRTMAADFLTMGRFAVRYFPHGEDTFALFLRAESGEAVQHAAAGSFEPATVSKEQDGAFRDSEQGAEFRLSFLAEVLTNVTEGRLHLCCQPGDLPALLPAIGEPIPILTPRALAPYRRRIETDGTVVGLPEGRIRELIIAAGEAAMNGIVHAGGCTVTLHGSPGGARMQVCVSDTGGGIAYDKLHRATLERGYTTAGTLGLGFSLMHSVVDRVYLLTGSSGTTLVLEQGAAPEYQEETRFSMAFH